MTGWPPEPTPGESLYGMPESAAGWADPPLYASRDRVTPSADPVEPAAEPETPLDTAVDGPVDAPGTAAPPRPFTAPVPEVPIAAPGGYREYRYGSGEPVGVAPVASWSAAVADAPTSATAIAPDETAPAVTAPPASAAPAVASAPWSGGRGSGGGRGDSPGDQDLFGSLGGRRPEFAPMSRPRAALALVLRTLGELSMTFGVIILMFVVYELYFTGIQTAHDQSKLLKTFKQQIVAAKTTPAAPSPTPVLGQGIALMYAPRLGKSWNSQNWVVVQGTTADDLAKGPGHIVGTQLPGQLGNFVVSGHRTTHLHPFYDVNEFKKGDAVIFETTTAWYVYSVQDEISVLPTDYGVTYPVPGDEGAPAKQRLLTLTTCNPRYSASHRLIVQAVLAYSQPLSAGAPAAMKTGVA